MSGLFKIITYRFIDPSQFTGLKIWLQNSSLGADGSSVTQWNDDSGNNNHFLQSSASYQPTVYTDGSEKTVSFLENSFLNCLNGLGVLKNKSGSTIYLVAKQLTTTFSPNVWVSTGFQTGANRVASFVNSNKYLSEARAIDSNNALQVQSVQIVNTASYMILGTSADFLNNDLRQYINSALDGSSINSGGSNSSNTDSLAIFLGAKAQFPSSALFPRSTVFPSPLNLAKMYVKELMIFDRVITEPEKVSVEQYLSVKHGIPLT